MLSSQGQVRSLLLREKQHRAGYTATQEQGACGATGVRKNRQLAGTLSNHRVPQPPHIGLGAQLTSDVAYGFHSCK